VDLDAWLFLALQAVHVAVAAGLVNTLLELPPGLLAGAKALSAGLSGTFGLAFLRRFLATRDRRPWLDAVLIAAAALAFAASLVVPFGLIAGNVAVTWTGLLAIAVSALATGEALASGHRGARTLLPGLVLFAAATGWYLLSLAALAPPSPTVVLVEIVGAVVTGTFITVAIAQQDEREEDVRKGALEALVAERTSGLQQALRALQEETAERRDAEERFRLAFETSPDPMAISRLEDGLLLAVNEGFLRLHGAREEEVLGRTASGLGLWVSPGERDAFSAQLARQGSVRDFEARFRGANGDTRLCLLTAGVLRQGGVAYVFSAGRDVTDARAAGARRQRLEEDLRQAQKLEAVGRLAAGVAHDFRNLLGVVLGNARMIALQAGMPPDIQEYARLIEEAAGRGAVLINELIDFGREPCGTPCVLNVPLAIATFLPLVRAAAGSRHAIVFTGDAGAGRVLIDRSNLERAVLNLVLNARDAMPDGGSIRIHAGIVQAAEHHGPPGAFVRIDVCDSGVGIASTDRERIFEPFYSTKPSGSGSGLGLASVRRILDRAGGFVRVESHVGVGTTLSIFLPRVSGDG
jgi:PAS domain S-box-containing protein